MLRSSPTSAGVTCCLPSITKLDPVLKLWNVDPLAPRSYECRIEFKFLEKTEGETPVRGACWSSLFCNPLLVVGYPILRREQADTGLEMSLGTMANLVRTRQVVKWGDRIIMKGFSTLLVATVASKGLIIWHLLCSESLDDRISYCDSRIEILDTENIKTLSLRSIEGSRHIVGWCANATDFCGKHRLFCWEAWNWSL